MESKTKVDRSDDALIEAANIEAQKQKNAILTKISQSIIANEVALDFNDQITRTNYHKRKLKHHLKATQVELAKAEKEEYDKVFGIAEKASSILYATMQTMVNEISSLGLYEFANITDLVRAYKKDPKSIAGIANKINRE